MMTAKLMIMLAVAVGVTTVIGCKTKTLPETGTVVTEDASIINVRNTGVRKMPRAVVYKTNGNWDNNVAVRWNRVDSTLIYYPDPYEVSDDTSPLRLADGWLLDRQGGIAVNTAFLSWTMEEYHKIAEVPSQKEIIAHIIPEAKVTEIMIVPMTNMDAQRDPAAVNEWLRKAQTW